MNEYNRIPGSENELGSPWLNLVIVDDFNTYERVENERETRRCVDTSCDKLMFCYSEDVKIIHGFQMIKLVMIVLR